MDTEVRIDLGTSTEPNSATKKGFAISGNSPAHDATTGHVSTASGTPSKMAEESTENTPRTTSSLNPSAKPYEPKATTPSLNKFQEPYYGDVALYIAATRLQIPALCTVSLYCFRKNFKHAVAEAPIVTNITKIIDFVLQAKVRGIFDLKHALIGTLACAYVDRGLDIEVVAAVKLLKPAIWGVVEDVTAKCKQRCEEQNKMVRNQLEASNSKATLKADVLAAKVEQMEEMCHRLATANELLQAEVLRLQFRQQSKADGRALNW